MIDFVLGTTYFRDYANPSCGVTVRRALEKPKGKIPLLGPCPAMEQERLKWQYKHMDNACKATVRAEREAQREKVRFLIQF